METMESNIGGGEAPVERTCIVILGHWDMLCFYLRGPESVRGSGLLYAFLCEMCVGPSDGIVSILL